MFAGNKEHTNMSVNIRYVMCMNINTQTVLIFAHIVVSFMADWIVLRKTLEQTAWRNGRNLSVLPS